MIDAKIMNSAKTCLHFCTSSQLKSGVSDCSYFHRELSRNETLACYQINTLTTWRQSYNSTLFEVNTCMYSDR